MIIGLSCHRAPPFFITTAAHCAHRQVTLEESEDKYLKVTPGHQCHHKLTN